MSEMTCDGLPPGEVRFLTSAPCEEVVRIEAASGDVWVNPKYTMSEAAKVFWEAVRKVGREAAPFTKVTEARGSFCPASCTRWSEVEWASFMHWDPEKGTSEVSAELENMLPAEAIETKPRTANPPGRFRVTVEFWPEAPKP